MILDALDKIRKQRLAEEQAATQDARAQAYLANQQATAAHYMKRDETVQQRADANDKKIAAQGRHTWQNDVITGLKNGVLPPGARIEMRDPDVPAGSDPWQVQTMSPSIQGDRYGADGLSDYTGNIDIGPGKRPAVKNPDGSVSSVYSMTFGPEADGSYVLVPGVRHGLDRQMTEDEAYAWYKQTGEHLGKFKSVADADGFAERLHQQQANMSSSGTSGQIDDVLAGGDASLGPDPEAQPAQPQLPPAPKQRKILVADYEGTPQEFDMSAIEEQKDAELRDHIAKLEAERDMPGNEAMVPKIQAEIIAARTKMSKEGHKAILDAQSQDQKSTDKLMLQNDKQEGDMEKEKFRQDRIDARMRMRAKKGAKTAKELAAKNEELDKQLKPGERNAILGAYRTIEVRVARADKVTQSYRRLKMAEDELNSDPKNPDNAMALAETFLNQNGVLREGVPVKHETDFILDTANKLNKWKLEARGMAGYAMQPELIRQLKVANEILKKNYQRFMQDTVKSVQSTGRGFSKPGRMVFQNLANGAYVVGGNEPMQIWKDTPLDTSNDVELFQKGGEDTETKAKSAKDAINGLRDMGLIK